MLSLFTRDVILRPTDPAFTPTVVNYEVDLRSTYPIVGANGRTYKALFYDAGLRVAEAGDLIFRSLSRENFESLWQLLDVTVRPESRKAEQPPTATASPTTWSSTSTFTRPTSPRSRQGP